MVSLRSRRQLSTKTTGGSFTRLLPPFRRIIKPGKNCCEDLQTLITKMHLHKNQRLFTSGAEKKRSFLALPSKLSWATAICAVSLFICAAVQRPVECRAEFYTLQPSGGQSPVLPPSNVAAAARRSVGVFRSRRAPTPECES